MIFFLTSDTKHEVDFGAYREGGREEGSQPSFQLGNPD